MRAPSLVARGLATTQAAGDADHIEIQVPNEKVIPFSFFFPIGTCYYRYRGTYVCSSLLWPS